MTNIELLDDFYISCVRLYGVIDSITIYSLLNYYNCHITYNELLDDLKIRLNISNNIYYVHLKNDSYELRLNNLNDKYINLIYERYKSNDMYIVSSLDEFLYYANTNNYMLDTNSDCYFYLVEYITKLCFKYKPNIDKKDLLDYFIKYLENVDSINHKDDFIKYLESLNIILDHDELDYFNYIYDLIYSSTRSPLYLGFNREDDNMDMFFNEFIDDKNAN